MHASDTNSDGATPQADKVRYADGAAALLGGHVEQIAHPQAPAWEQVKQNASRTVYRGRIGAEDIYLKHFHSRTLAHRLGRVLGLSDALAEMRYSQHLLARGVPAVQVLAATCDADVEWLATRAVASAQPGDEWHERQLARGEEGLRAIRAATLALADLIGHMHAAGVVHHDLHCGNVLVRTDADPVELVLTDLHRASLRRRLSRRARAANVALLLHDRRHVTTRTDRLRFLRRYLQASKARGSLRGWELQIDDFARRHTRCLNRQRDRRAVGTNRYFARIRLPGGWRGHVVKASKRRLADSQAATLTFDAGAWREVLEDPASLLTGEGCTVLKESQSSLVVRRSLTVGEHTLDVVVKRARRKHGWKVLIDCFRTSRSLRAFRMGHALLSRRIANVLPLAAVERRSGLLLTDSILITEFVDDPKLNDFFYHGLSHPQAEASGRTPAQQRRLGRDVLWRTGRLVQKLHDHRFAHRDLKANNVLVHCSPGRPPELVLVDLDGLWPVRVLTTQRRFQALMRLNVSLLPCPAVTHAGRLRGLLGYLRRPGCGRVNFKPTWRVLEEWSGRKLRQQARRKQSGRSAS
jgi:tRNA A-37 threonylcarbamoyl transferase component Bud32